MFPKAWFSGMDIAQFLGWVATVLFTVCFIPQIIKMRKSKTVDGLSFLFLFITLVANSVALVYAVLIEQMPLQIKYILALVFLVPCIVLYTQIWRRGQKRTEN